MPVRVAAWVVVMKSSCSANVIECSMIERLTANTPSVTLSSAQLFLVYTGRVAETRWLSAEEQQTWRTFMCACHAFFSAVDGQLQRDSGMPLTYYEILVRLS